MLYDIVIGTMGTEQSKKCMPPKSVTQAIANIGMATQVSFEFHLRIVDPFRNEMRNSYN